MSTYGKEKFSFHLTTFIEWNSNYFISTFEDDVKGLKFLNKYTLYIAHLESITGEVLFCHY